MTKIVDNSSNCHSSEDDLAPLIPFDHSQALETSPVNDNNKSSLFKNSDAFVDILPGLDKEAERMGEVFYLLQRRKYIVSL